MKVNSNRTPELLALCSFLIVITLTLYWQVSGHDFINYDDFEYVTRNINVKTGLSGANILWAFTSFEAANWHPLTWLSHQLDAQLFGMNPYGHHLMSLFIHVISAVLLLLLLFRWTGALWQSSFVAAVFALHPLHVESVAWIAERKDVLSGFFWFLALLLYREFAVTRKFCFYLLCLGSYILGLMSKSMLVTLPVVMLLIDFWPLDRYNRPEPSPGSRLFGRKSARVALILEKIPFFTCALISAALTLYAQNKGAIQSIKTIPVSLRLENAVIAYMKYIVLTFWPHNLALAYLLPTSYPLWQFISAVLTVVVITALVIFYGRRQPYLIVGWFWFLITLLPVIGLIQVGTQAMADRYMYIPQTGLILMIAWGVPAMVTSPDFRRLLVAPLAGVALVAMCLATGHQLPYWHDTMSIFQHTLAVEPENVVVRYSLAIVLEKKGDLDGAIREYRRALMIQPDYASAQAHLTWALHAKAGRK